MSMPHSRPADPSRRRFVQSTSLFALGTLIGCAPSSESNVALRSFDELNAFLAEATLKDGAVGYSAALVKGDRLIWSNGFGMADRAKNIEMTPQHIQNIGSISKTITATAVMQLWEEDRFKLDDDINAFLPFSVRNPRFPNEPITFRQLLTHRSSITDGPSYDASYACGDPAVSLEDWIKGYFQPEGAYYDAEANFHVWKPGTTNPPEQPRAYTNVGFGLLGYLVEQITGQPFTDYCRGRIFEPLGMENTGWLISEIDQSKHAVTYTALGDDPKPPEDGSLDSMLPADGFTVDDLVPGGYIPHCLYSFYNYPDGLLRTNVEDLSRFLRAYMGGGVFSGARILKPETVDLMLSKTHYERGLCWDTYAFYEENTFWGHDGGDPGVATLMAYHKEENIGLLMFYNYGEFGDSIEEILKRLLQELRMV